VHHQRRRPDRRRLQSAEDRVVVGEHRVILHSGFDVVGTQHNCTDVCSQGVVVDR
jgi:hypothetical protein